MSTPNALREFLLAFADDEHLMGQQHTEWIGVAPFLEEDLAFSSIGQDELGHAVLLYELVCELDGTDKMTDAAIDALAYGRGAEEYRSCDFTEFVTTNWAEALVRHWIYDMVEDLRWGLVANSSHVGLSAVSDRVAREESYHRMHANALLDVLLDDSVAKAKLIEALDKVGPLTPSLLGATEGESELVQSGIISAPASSLGNEVTQQVSQRFGLEWIVDASAIRPRDSERSSHFSPLMTRMREVIDYDPEASW